MLCPGWIVSQFWWLLFAILSGSSDVVKIRNEPDLQVFPDVMWFGC